MTSPEILLMSPAGRGTSLQDVRDHLVARTDLDARRKRDLISAVDRIGKLLKEDLASIPLDDFPALSERLSEINPVASRITSKTLANVRAGLMSAVRESGLKPGVMHDHGISNLTDEWKQLLAPLSDERSQRGIARLAHYCSWKGIQPGQVEDAVIAAMMAEVHETSLRRNQARLHRITTIVWNEVANRYPELSLQPVTVPESRRVYTRLKWSEFPESFQNDVNSYSVWCSASDPFDKDSRKKPLAPGTIETQRGYINAAATALVRHGTSPSKITKLADLVTVKAMRSIFRERYQAVDRKESVYNVCMATALLQIARDWVHADEDTFTELKRLASNFPRDGMGRLTEKNKRLLHQFDDPRVIVRLVDTPLRMWREVMEEEKPNWRTLAKAEAAIAIASLTYIPIRLQNLVSLTFDKHLFLQRAPGAKSTCDIPGDEVKNKVPLLFEIKAHVVKMLDEFREILAPKILGHRPNQVFVNEDGSLKTEAGVRYLIQTYMWKRVGVEFNPHVFRHLAGKIILDQNPGAYELVRQFLGQKRLSTTVNFYTGTDTLRASRYHQDLLEASIATMTQPSRRKKKAA